MNSKMRTLVIALIAAMVLWIVGGVVFGEAGGMMRLISGYQQMTLALAVPARKGQQPDKHGTNKMRRGGHGAYLVVWRKSEQRQTLTFRPQTPPLRQFQRGSFFWRHHPSFPPDRCGDRRLE